MVGDNAQAVSKKKKLINKDMFLYEFTYLKSVYKHFNEMKLFGQHVIV